LLLPYGSGVEVILLLFKVVNRSRGTTIPSMNKESISYGMDYKYECFHSLQDVDISTNIAMLKID
jgi:hypothetical protein